MARKTDNKNNIVTKHMTDPLDQNIDDIDVSFPRLAVGLYELQIAKVEKVPNNAGTGENLKVELKTTKEAVSTVGEAVGTGMTLIHNISLTPTEKYGVENMKRNITSFALSAGLKNRTVRSVINAGQELAGKFVTAKIGIQRETDEFPERNTIKAFVTKG